MMNDDDLFCVCVTVKMFYIDVSVSWGITPLIKFMRKYIRDLSGVFSTSLLARLFIDDVSSRLARFSLCTTLGPTSVGKKNTEVNY